MPTRVPVVTAPPLREAGQSTSSSGDFMQLNSNNKQRLVRPLSLLALAGLLAGCATMSADECLVADWYQLGQFDAREGRQANYLAQRSAACAEAGITADNQAWHAGYQNGLQWFCTTENGFRHGQSGQLYRRICPPALESAFLDGYDVGFGMHSVKQRMTRHGHQLDRVLGSLEQALDQPRVDRQQLRRLEAERDRIEQALRADELELAGLRGVAIGRGLVPAANFR